MYLQVTLSRLQAAAHWSQGVVLKTAHVRALPATACLEFQEGHAQPETLRIYMLQPVLLSLQYLHASDLCIEKGFYLSLPPLPSGREGRRL